MAERRQVELSSAIARVRVEPSHGMTISSIRVAGHPADLLWSRPSAAPQRLRRRLGRAGARSIDSLHELLIGGWFELSPHAGLPGRLDGRATMLHGEASRLPWRIDAVDRSRLVGSVRATRYPLLMERRIEINDGVLVVESSLRNDSIRAWTVTHGEHPCFDRSAFAGGVIWADVRTAQVLEPFDPGAASLRPGPFQWPLAVGRDSRPRDVSVIPARPSGTQDHIALSLASPTIRMTTSSGLTATLEVDLERHPYVLLWRHFRAPGGPGLGTWDVFAVEPQSTLGYGVVDAHPADLTILEPGAVLSTRVSLTLADDADRTGPTTGDDL